MAKLKKPKVKKDKQMGVWYVELGGKPDQEAAEGFGYAIHFMDGKGRVFPEPPTRQEARLTVLRIVTARTQVNATVARG